MKSRIYNTRATVEAGLITALIVVMALMNVYIPIFSTLGRFILPIPVAVLFLRHNFKVTLAAVVASGIFVGMLYSPLSGLTSTIMFGITGITLGYCIKKNSEFSIMLILLSIASLIGTVIDFSVYIKLISGSSLKAFIGEMLKIMEESANAAIEFYTKMGVSNEQLKPILDILKIFNVDYILKVVPAILIMGSLVSAYLTYIVTKLILKKLGYNIKEAPKFTHIHINVKIGAILSIFLLLGVLLIRQNVEVGEYLAGSSQLLLQYAFFIDGLSVALYYLKDRYKMSKGVITLIIFLTMFSQLSIVYFILGLADLIIDFRKLDPNRKLGVK
ncbi:uncharacterized protein YybS (DUF2232 family) [Clostridium tetanomorphum]|uniref:DUF2232 domain-containing protein n=1 Tax=Clostridium tetanomorphum TaxID=1553 RepID=A0A923E9K1_CLOTT|nr:YybS family protein [Clostridium tetanomorphum]MBC2398985.1 DUF2232 domain-containing protein [Clostridium tetanomorphum]MBP1866191.1 uncharacterized protein YybS (DUF2232 family) [Clostridium tetanomorphum]NRS86617.1 uncharacterized protein YybS (DUF2232 family) [Clostridium tetanomorphum]NRZ95392.1 uncharacterized protein YybS (DUF2232 family) [Clostridium tetanomorphum]